MPLPKALAARLAKRGLLKINSQSNSKDSDKETSVHEEIIAEDYDETPNANPNGHYAPDLFDKYQGWYACPNKWNVYHECSSHCQELWKNIKELDKNYNKKRIKMLLKYPLAEHWREILDIGIGRYYYWNTETNLVSWLPPGHPKCQVSVSASELRKNMMQERELRVQEEKEVKSDDDQPVADEDDLKPKRNRKDDSNYDSLDDSEDEIKEKKRDRRDKLHDRRPKRKRKEDVLDPMDPAAYSDCPRGTWSSGLEERNEARTGVDTTASGPLFQMRPYPSPGAVLRANASSTGVGPQKPT